METKKSTILAVMKLDCRDMKLIMTILLMLKKVSKKFPTPIDIVMA